MSIALARKGQVGEGDRADPSIYTQCFTSAVIAAEGWCKICQSVEHSTEKCPMKAAKPVDTRLTGTRKRHFGAEQFEQRSS